MWRRFVGSLFADVSKNRSSAFVFNMERYNKMWDCLTVKAIALRSVETSVTFYQSVQYNIPEDLAVHYDLAF